MNKKIFFRTGKTAKCSVKKKMAGESEKHCYRKKSLWILGMEKKLQSSELEELITIEGRLLERCMLRSSLKAAEI